MDLAQRRRRWERWKDDTKISHHCDHFDHCFWASILRFLRCISIEWQLILFLFFLPWLFGSCFACRNNFSRWPLKMRPGCLSEDGQWLDASIRLGLTRLVCWLGRVQTQKCVRFDGMVDVRWNWSKVSHSEILKFFGIFQFFEIHLNLFHNARFFHRDANILTIFALN